MNLDLRLISPGGNTIFPWKLNGNQPAAAATQGDNNVDNVEQVVVASPVAGTYRVRISHKGTLHDSSGIPINQSFSLLLSGNAPEPPLAFTSTLLLTVGGQPSISLKWSSVIGRVYQVQYRDDVATGGWQAATGEIVATATNVTVVLSRNTARRFYRLLRLR